MLLVFDLDGTLIDSMRDLADSASEMVCEFGGRALDATTVTTMVGDGAAMLVRRAIEASGAQVDGPRGLDRFLTIYDRRLLEHTRPYPGMVEALTLASHRHRLAVLTNKPTAPSNKILAGLHLADYFDRVIGGDGTYPRKPDPAGLTALMSDGGVAATVLIGDSPVDEQTARAAGCPFVLAKYGFGYARYAGVTVATPFVLERPSDLAEMLERLERVTSGM